MKMTKQRLKQIIKEELVIIEADRGTLQKVSSDELEEFRTAGEGTYGVMPVTREQAAMSYAANFLKEHRILGMYQSNIWFQHSDGTVYKIGY